MSFSRKTSSGYLTGDEGSRVRGPSNRTSQRRFCPECNCYLEAISREIEDLEADKRHLRCQLMQESVSGVGVLWTWSVYHGNMANYKQSCQQHVWYRIESRRKNSSQTD